MNVEVDLSTKILLIVIDNRQHSHQKEIFCIMCTTY